MICSLQSYVTHMPQLADVDCSARAQGDLSAEKMIMGVEGVDPQRRDMLLDLLDIDLGWCVCTSSLRHSLPAIHFHVLLHQHPCCTRCRRLNRVSDGQRRRVQICLGLLKPYKVGRWSAWLYT